MYLYRLFVSGEFMPRIVASLIGACLAIGDVVSGIFYSYYFRNKSDGITDYVVLACYVLGL